MLSHQALCLSAANTAKVEEGYQDDGFKSLAILPLWHVLGLTNGVLSCMLKGSEIYFIQTMKPNLLVSSLKECQISGMLVTPVFCSTIYKKLLHGINELPFYKRIPINLLHNICQFVGEYSQKYAYYLAHFLFRSLRAKIAPDFGLIISGGARINPKMIKPLLGWGYLITYGYGLTETCGSIAYSAPLSFEANSVGTINPECKVKVLNPNEDGVGEICLKTKQLMDGYLNQPDLTRSVYTDDGWFRTGDLGYIDKESRLFISG